MYNDRDEMYEVSDFDEDVERRKELLEQAKQLDQNAEWNTVFQEVSNLQRQWKRIPYWESAYEDQLEEEFDSYINVFYNKRRENYQSNQEMKEALIEQARKLSMAENFNSVTEAMNDLMQQWKRVGSAGKELDDTLWEAFNEARQTFFERKKEHWTTMQAQFANALDVKKKLILQAKEIVDKENLQETGEQFRKLMDEWKAVGFAGKEHEDELWNEFHEIRQKFYDRRNAHYEEIRAELDQKYEIKKGLLEQAKAIADKKEYHRENTNQMKQLHVEWKNTGSCGKEREDQIWKNFRTIMDQYFEGLREWNEQRHMQWRQRMMENRTRKLELIQKQKRQIKYMEDEIVGLLGQRAIDDMMEQIEDKKEFVVELEEQLADIDKALKEEK